LVKLIKKKIEDNPRRWHEVLSEALWAHRISRHGATKVTPFELVYGQEAVLPVEVNLGAYRLAKQNNLSFESYYASMMDNIDEVTDKRMEALEEIEKDKRRVARVYNKRVKAKSFQVHDLVWKTVLPMDLKVTSSASGLQVGKVRTWLSRFVLGILTWWKPCKDSDF
jgi:hypothetical protein